jgi:hypothetical protein
MKLAFALMAAINASTGFCVTLSHGLFRTKPRRRQPGGRRIEGFSLLMGDGASAEGKRMALPNSRILIHQPSGGFEGQSSDIEIHAREVLALRARVDDLYAKHTGQSVERVHADMERDRYFTGEEAVAYGLVERVIERRELAKGARGFGER